VFGGILFRSYRCYYSPRDALGQLTASDNGALPFVQVKAANAEAALLGAQRVTGCPASEVERLEQAS